MSDSQAYEEVRISSDGVTVTKRFEEDEFPVPAIAFEFVTERDEPVTVTLSDKVPDSVAVEDLGFHPEYGSEFWTVDDEEISFEREFDADSEYTSVYGIRATGADDVEKFLTEPVIESVDPPLPGGTDDAANGEPDDIADNDIVPEGDDDIVKDVISGDGNVPGLEDEEEPTDEEIETLDLKDPNAAGEATAAVTTETDDGSDPPADTQADDDADEEPEPTTAETNSTAETDTSADPDIDTDSDDDTDSVVSAMAREIRQDEVPVEDLKLVQRAIDKLADRDETGSGDGAHDARVDKLQSDIADLRAYTDALEEFLDEEGTGDQLIRDFESQLEEFDRTLDQVQSDLSETTDTVSEVSDEVDSVSEELDDVESSISELESALESVEADVEELEGQVADGDVGARMEDMEEELEDLREWQDQIKSTFGG